MSLNRELLQAFVQENYMPVLSDQVFESSDVLKYMMKKAKTQGGKDIIISPVLYDKPTAHGAVKGFGPVDINPNKKWTAVDFDWRTIYTTIALSFDETDATEGDSNAIMSLVENEMKVAKLTLQDDLGNALYNDGSDTDVPHGLRHIISTDRTLGDIDSTTYAWFDANKLADTTNYTAANLVDPTSAYYCLKLLRTEWQAAKHNNDKPDLISISAGWEGILEEELFPYTRYQNKENPASIDFDGFDYRGKAMFLQDDLNPAGWLFMINTNWLFPVVHRARNMRIGPWQTPVNMLDGTMVANISMKMNFVCNAPRMQAAIQAAAAVG
jgi:hypothetical protein